jgi:hypothetical protein
MSDNLTIVYIIYFQKQVMILQKKIAKQRDHKLIITALACIKKSCENIFVKESEYWIQPKVNSRTLDFLLLFFSFNTNDLDSFIQWNLTSDDKQNHS